jgi:hypothetical protein
LVPDLHSRHAEPDLFNVTVPVFDNDGNLYRRLNRLRFVQANPIAHH